MSSRSRIKKVIFKKNPLLLSRVNSLVVVYENVLGVTNVANFLGAQSLKKS